MKSCGLEEEMKEDEDTRNKETEKKIRDIHQSPHFFINVLPILQRSMVTAGDSEKTERCAVGLFTRKKFSSRVDEGCCSYASTFALRLSLPGTVLSANLAFLSSKFGKIFFVAILTILMFNYDF